MMILSSRFCLCVFAVLFYYHLPPTLAQFTHPSEVSSLKAIKSSLYDPNKNLENWKNTDPCSANWTGVLCFDRVGDDGYFHVRELLLMNMNLSGNLASEIGQLSHLQILNFMWNDLNGNIPREIGKISTLILLLLNGNRFSGLIPDELGYLANLDRFQIDQNQISGPIPKSISNLKSIRHLHFNNNSLSGQIPNELSNLSTLVHLLLDNNNLSGYLPPDLSSVPELRIVQLDNNNFSGTEIPASYGNMHKLIKLSLRNCSLTGLIPDISKIPKLTYLDLGWNQLTGGLPLNLSSGITTIALSHNRLNGSIPESYSNHPFLQTMSLEDNFLTGTISADIWQNLSFSSEFRLLVDLQNNILSSIIGDLDPPDNVTLRLLGNPVCRKTDIKNIDRYCSSQAELYDNSIIRLTNSNCPIHACPIGNYYDYVEASPIPCSCASPLRIGYRLKSPSFSYFPPYELPFKLYLTRCLNLQLYQVLIDSYDWEEGPRLRMYLKLYPENNDDHSGTFNSSEVRRIREYFSAWQFPGSDTFGPYELLNFTLLGPYSYENFPLESKGISNNILIVIILAAIVFTITASTIATVLIIRKYDIFRHHRLSRKGSKLSIKIEGVKSFSFKELSLGTNNFNPTNQVGHGGYGNVYRGILFDRTIAAIKRSKEGSLQGQKQFLTEIELMSRLHHRNLVCLLGYCDEEAEQMLVYEFMPNGSLREWLSGKCGQNLDFGARLHIALGAARGILYLHTEANPPIFHRDIKSSNILLDSKLNAKVADFGLSRLAPDIDDDEIGGVPHHVSTIVRGTPGYLDPEYFLTNKLTDKSDVYSLGVVFLEILTGKHPILHGKNIVREAKAGQISGTMFTVIDNRMGAYPSECVEKFVSLGLRCCQEKPDMRPSMADVVRELEKIFTMFPDTEGTDSVESTYKYLTESMQGSSSSSGMTTTRKPCLSANVSGSDLVSGISMTLMPR